MRPARMVRQSLSGVFTQEPLEMALENTAEKGARAAPGGWAVWTLCVLAGVSSRGAGESLGLILRRTAFLTRRDVTEVFLTQAWAVQGNVSFATGAIFSSAKTDPVLWGNLLTETTGTL